MCISRLEDSWQFGYKKNRSTEAQLGEPSWCYLQLHPSESLIGKASNILGGALHSFSVANQHWPEVSGDAETAHMPHTTWRSSKWLHAIEWLPWSPSNRLFVAFVGDV